MSRESQKFKTVYFLGAGFSRGANFPLQNGLISRINSFSPDNILSFNTDLFAAYNRFSKQRDKTAAFLNRVFQGTPSPNLEDVFTLLDHSISERSFCRGISWKNLISIDEALKSNVLFSLHAASLKATEAQLDLYKKIAGHLLHTRVSEKEKVSVISVNWDSLVEDNIYYWIKSLNKTEEVDVDYCCYTMPLDGSPHTPSITQKSQGILNFKILKLHGSTNWLVCESCKKIYTGVGSELSAFHLYFSDSRFCRECSEMEFKTNPKLIPFIITPTFLKAFPNPHIQNIWLNAYTELNEANRIVFVGYSLPEADFFVRSLLRRSIRPSTEIEVVLWKTDQPTKAQKSMAGMFAKSRYESFFGEEKPSFHFNGVEEYFSHRIYSSLGTTKRALSLAISRQQKKKKKNR